MQVIVEPTGDVIVVTLITDQLDAANADQFSLDMEPVVKRYLKVALDLERVRFIDSRGCGVILNCLKVLIGRGGSMRLCRVQRDVRTVFDLIRLPRICHVHETREQAIAAFSG